MATPISSFREIIRILVGDNDPDIQYRDDSQIDAAVRAVVNLGKVTGDLSLHPATASYYMNQAGDGIIPELTPISDPKAFAQASYHAAKLFAVDITPTHWRTRAFSETVGENRERVFNLLVEIYNTENGGQVGGSSFE